MTTPSEFAAYVARHLDDPHRVGDAREFGYVTSGLLALTGPVAHGRPACARTVLSVVGSYVRAALRDVRRREGDHRAIAVVDAYEGTSPHDEAVAALFPGRERRRVERAVVQETGLVLASVRRLLPAVVPMVLKLLHAGAPAVGGAVARRRENPVLIAFLLAERDGDVELGEVVHLLADHLGPRTRL